MAPSLSARRKIHSLNTYYKIIKGLCPKYITSILPTQVQNITNYNLRNRSNRRPKFTRLKSSQNSFIPWATREWNKLDINIRESPSLNIFKNKITPKTTFSHYNRLCSGYNGKLLTRLRLGLSGLHAHLFKYNFKDSPICPLCQSEPETSYHFFLSCPTHHLARYHFFQMLSSELNLDPINSTNILKTILYGQVDLNLQPILLRIVYQYIELTGRFSQG